MSLSSYTTPDLTRMRESLADTLAHTPPGHLAWYGRTRDLVDMDAELARRVEKTLDEFSAMIAGWDSVTLLKLKALAVEGLREGRPGNFAGMIERLDHELNTERIY